MTLLLHLGEATVSHRWQRHFTWVKRHVQPSGATNDAVFLHGNSHPLARILPYIYQDYVPDMETDIRRTGFCKKKRKSTSWGYRKFRHRILLFISAIQWRNKKLLQRRNKNRTNVTKTNYSTQFRYRKPRYGPAMSRYRHHRQVEQLPPAPIYGCHRWHSLAKHRKPERFQEPTK